MSEKLLTLGFSSVYENHKSLLERLAALLESLNPEVLQLIECIVVVQMSPKDSTKVFGGIKTIFSSDRGFKQK